MILKIITENNDRFNINSNDNDDDDDNNAEDDDNNDDDCNLYLKLLINLSKTAKLINSVGMSLFIDGTVKCKLPSTSPSTGLSRIQY
jgi:hypothetical protein